MSTNSSELVSMVYRMSNLHGCEELPSKLITEERLHGKEVANRRGLKREGEHHEESRFKR